MDFDGENLFETTTWKTKKKKTWHDNIKTAFRKGNFELGALKLAYVVSSGGPRFQLAQSL
jgi:hypothetical protein